MDLTRNMKGDEVDILLKKALLKTPITWENTDKIRAINNALKAKDVFHKRIVLAKYR